MHKSFVLIVAVLVGVACSGPRTVVEDQGPRVPTMDDKLRQLPEVESFDPAPYPTNPPNQNVVVEHAVPSELMEGRASAGLTSQRTGYRVQIALARAKDDADVMVDEVTQWLENMREEYPATRLFQKDLPIHNIYLQPYFRIRLGDFSSRESAEELLQYVIDEFPRALVVVDQVTIQR